MGGPEKRPGLPIRAKKNYEGIAQGVGWFSKDAGKQGSGAPPKRFGFVKRGGSGSDGRGKNDN